MSPWTKAEKLSIISVILACLIGIIVMLYSLGIISLQPGGMTGAATANLPPQYTASSTKFVTNQFTPVLVNLGEMFNDPEGRPLTFIATQTENLVVKVNENQLTITPEYGFTGTRVVTILASDGEQVTRKRLSIDVIDKYAASSEPEQPAVQPPAPETPQAEPQAGQEEPQSESPSEQQAPVEIPQITTQEEQQIYTGDANSLPDENIQLPMRNVPKIEPEVEAKLENETEITAIIFLNESIAENDALNFAAQSDDRRANVLARKKALVSRVKEKFYENKGFTASSGFRVTRNYNTISAMEVKLTKQGLEQLRNDPSVSMVVAEKIIYTTLPESVPLINADSVWNLTYNSTKLDGRGIAVCIIDTGIDFNHSAFANKEGKIFGGYDYVNLDDSPQDDAGNSHGTHCSGIIGGNSSAVTGTSPNIRIVPVKVCDSGGGCPSGAIFAGVDYCNDHVADYNILTISASLGSGSTYTSANCPTDLDSLLSTSVSLGIIPVFASGNGYTYGSVSWPSCSPYAVSVGSTTKDDAISAFSNYGGDRFDVFAPGSSIVSSIIGGGTGSLSGTSMATPHAASLIALMQQNEMLNGRSRLSLTQVHSRLNSTGLNITGPWKRVDVYALIQNYNTNININLSDNSVTNASNPAKASKVRFKNSTDFGDFLDCTNMGYKFIAINSTSPKCAKLNKSAHIRFEGVQGNSVNILRDGEQCTAEYCDNLTFAGHVVEFDVTSFSNYTTNASFMGMDNPLSCPVVINQSAILTQDLYANDSCIIFGRDNSTLDCDGYYIYYRINGGYYESAVEARDRSNVTIKNCNIVNMNSTGFYPGQAINFTNTNYSTIVNNTINVNGNGAYAINASAEFFTDVHNNSIINNRIITNGSNNVAIQIYRSRDSNITSNQISAGSSNGYPALWVLFGASLNISSNNISTGTGGGSFNLGIFGSLENSTIINNTITTNGTSNDDAIQISGALNQFIANSITAINGMGINIPAPYGSYRIISNVILTNGTGNSNQGIRISGRYHLIANNTITTDGAGAFNNNHGLYAHITANSNITGNSISAKGSKNSHGIYFYSRSDNNTVSFNNITANANTSAAILIEKSNGSNFTGNRLVNSYVMLNITDSSKNNFTNTTFASDYSAINIPYRIELNGSVEITQSKLNTSFNYAYMNSNNLTFFNSTGIITFSSLIYSNPRILVDWNDDALYEECSTEVCSKLGYVNHNLVFNVSHFTSYTTNETFESIASCPVVINRSSTLANDISSSGTCIHINGSNLEFDCNGYSIAHNTGGGGYNAGINVLSGRSNVTISGCTIKNANTGSLYNYGINISGSNNIIYNNAIYENASQYAYGINLYGSITQNTVANNTIRAYCSYYGYGINIETGPTANLIENNTITINATQYNAYGINIFGSGNGLTASSNNVLSNNTILVDTYAQGSGGADGIAITNYAYGNTARRNIIRMIRPANSGSYGIYLYANASWNTIDGNNISSLLGFNTAGVYSQNYAQNNQIVNNIMRVGGGYGYQNYGIAMIGAGNIADLISNTTVANNTIYTNGSWNNFGIYLNSIGFSHVENNTITTNGTDTSNFGMRLYGSNTIYNSVIGNNIRTYGPTAAHGIVLQTGPPFNLVKYNNITANGGYSNFGLILTDYSDNNTVNYNNLTALGADSTGFLIVNSQGTTAWGNNITVSGSDGFYISNDYLNQYATTAIDTQNMINGSPIYYYGGAGASPACPNNQTIDNPAYAHIDIIGCNNFTLTNYQAFEGMTLAGATNNTITYARINTTAYPLRIWHNSSGNNISYSSFTADNTTGAGYGVWLRYWANNNTIASNNISAIVPAVANNRGVYFDGYSADNNITNNQISTNGTQFNYGAYITGGASRNILANNAIRTKGSSTSNYGAYLHSGVSGNVLNNNTIFANGTGNDYGIYIYTYAANNTVSNNTILTDGTSGSNYGVYIQTYSVNNTIRGNRINATNFNSVTNVGIQVQDYASNCVIDRNNISTSSLRYGHGVFIKDNVANTIVSNNTISIRCWSDSTYGMHLYNYARYSTIDNNTISTNGTSLNHGIYLYSYSDYNNITNNLLLSNATGTTNAGIYLYNPSSSNRIIRNTIITNGTGQDHALLLQTNANNNYFESNNISAYGGTDSYGILITGSTGNYFNSTILRDSAQWLYTDSANNFSNTTFASTGNGSVSILPQIQLNTTTVIVASRINITYNRTFVNASNLTFFNTSAVITMSSLPYANNASIVADFADTGSYASCPADTCTNLGYSSGTLTFNTSHFTSFGTMDGGGEGPITQNITGCEPGPVLVNQSITLSQSIASNNTCLQINNDSVVLDCAGYTIRFNANGTDYEYGILAENKTNITIRNCGILDINDTGASGMGLKLANVTNSTVINNNATTNGTMGNIAIMLNVSENAFVENNTFLSQGTGNANKGMYLINSTNLTINSNNVLTRNTQDNNGIELLNAVNTAITNNTIRTNGTGSNNIGILTNAGSGLLVARNAITTDGTIGSAGISIGNTYWTNYSSVANNTINSGGSSTGNVGLLVSGVWNNVTGNIISTRGSIGNFGIDVTSPNNMLSWNTIVTNGSSGNNGMRIRIAANNNVFYGNNITTNGTNSYGISITAGNGSIFNATRFTDTTEWIETYPNTFNNFTNTTFLTSQGSINILPIAQVNGSQIITRTKLNITQYKAFLNSTALPSLNTSAIITLNGIVDANPEPVVDYEDDETYMPCPAEQCTELSYTPGVSYVFNTTHFTKYTTTDTGTPITSCPVLINQSTQLTQSLESNTSCIEIGNNSITLDCSGFSVRFNGMGNDYDYGIRAENRTNITITNCNVLDINATGKWVSGIVLKNVTNSTIIYSTAESNCSNNNTVVKITNSSNTNITRNTIISKCTSGESYGILSNNSLYNLFSHNTVISNGTTKNYGISIIGNNNTAAYNNVTMNGSLLQHAVNVDKGLYNTVVGNNVVVNWPGSTSECILLTGANFTLIENNTLAVNLSGMGYGVDAYATSNNTFLRNNITVISTFVSYGIRAGLNNTINDNTISLNLTSDTMYGIDANHVNVINNNTISVLTSDTDGYAFGIYAGNGIIARNNNIRTYGGRDIYGIYVLGNSSADSNTINLTAFAAGPMWGINTGGQSNVTNNNITVAGTDYLIGINTGALQYVENNTVNVLSGTYECYGIDIGANSVARKNNVTMTVGGDWGAYGIFAGNSGISEYNIIFVNSSGNTVTGIDPGNYYSALYNNITVSGSYDVYGLQVYNWANVTNNRIMLVANETGNAGIYASGNTWNSTIANNVIITTGNQTRGIALVSAGTPIANITVNYNSIEANGTLSHGIYTSNAVNSTFVGNNITSSNEYGIWVELGEFNWFENTTLIDPASWLFVSNKSRSNNNFTRTQFAMPNGSIHILSTVMLEDGTNVTKSKLNISFNKAYLNSTNLSSINTTAEITLNNIVFTDPRPIVDYNDDGSYETCPPSQCTELGAYVPGGVYAYNTTHFTGYSSEETAACPRNFTSSTILAGDISCENTAVLLEADNITLDCNNYTVYYASNSLNGTNGIHAEGHSNLIVKNCIIRQVNPALNESIAINFTYVNNSRIENCLIVTNGTVSNQGITAQFAYNTTIVNNTILTGISSGSLAGNTGIQMFFGANLAYIANNTVVSCCGNTIKGISGYANATIVNNIVNVTGQTATVGIWTYHDGYVENNTVVVHGWNIVDGVLVSGVGPFAKNNTVYANGTNNVIGLDMGGSLRDGGTVANNNVTISGTNNVYGIYADTNNTIENNTVRAYSGGGSNYGFWIYGNNTLRNNSILMNGTSSNELIRESRPDNVIIGNNITMFSATNDNAVIYALSGTVIQYNNFILNGSGSTNVGLEIAYNNNFPEVIGNNITVSGSDTTTGIHTSGQTNLTIQNNNVTITAISANNYAIHLDGGIAGANIGYNSITASGADQTYGVLLAGTITSENNITGNNITVTQGGFDSAGLAIITAGTITGQNVRNNLINISASSSPGVLLSNATTCTLTGNNVTSTNGYAVYINGGGSNSFANTSLTAPMDWLIAGSGTSGNTFIRTLFAQQDGSILILPSVMPDNTDATKAKLNITYNRAFLNSTNLTSLNFSAEITLNGIVLADPVPVVDYEDDGSYTACPADQCTELSYSGGVFVFNTTHFTGYSSQESSSGITSCPVTINESTTLTQNLTNDTQTCIKINNSNTVLDCNGHALQGNDTAETFGIFSENVTNLTIKNCVVIDWDGGIKLSNTSSDLLLNNTAISNRVGFLLDAGMDYYTSNNTLENNSAIGNDDTGILVENTQNNTIIGNVLNNNLYYGTRIYGDLNFIYNNTAINNSHGIVVNAGRDVFGFNNTIENNTAVNNTQTGIGVSGTQNNTIKGNMLRKNLDWGISANGVNDLIYNNTFIENGIESFTIEAFNGAWHTVSIEHFPRAYALHDIAVPAGTTLVRVTQTGTDTAHIDMALLDGMPPAGAMNKKTNELLPLKPISARDYDVIDASERAIEFSWAQQGTMFSLVAVEEDVDGIPLSWPDNKVISYVIGQNKTFERIWKPVSAHPESVIFAEFSAMPETLNLYLDMTPDNTLDYGGDWAELRINTTSGMKAFRINSTETTWGTPDFTYTDKAVWRHKTYLFAIPLSEINAVQGDEINFQIGYYGTGFTVPDAGIKLQGMYNLVFNNVHQGDENGIYAYTAESCIIANNSINGSLAAGIMVRLGVDNNVSGNTLHNNNLGIGINMSEPILLADNNATDNTEIGIFLESISSNTLIRNTGSSPAGIGIRISASTGNNITNTTLSTNSGKAISIDSTSLNNIFTNTAIFTNSTWLLVDEGSTGTILNNTLFIGANGTIRIPGNATLPEKSNATIGKLNISFNRAFLNSTNLSFLNTSAEIQLFNLSFASPVAYVDFEDDGAYSVCPPSVCPQQGYSGGAFTFNVTQFTGYSAGEAPISNISNITITKTDRPDPVNVSTNLTYQINVSVRGNGTAYNVTVNETYPNEIIYLTAVPAPTAGNNSWALGTLTQGTNFSINITVLVLNITSGSIINNTANVTFNNETSAFLGSSATAPTTVLVPAAAVFNFTNMTIRKTDSPDPVNASSILTYQINVSSVGNGTAYNVTVNDTYPNEVIYLTAVPAPTTGNNTWTLGSLTAGTNFSINITVLVLNITNGSVINNTANATFQNETSGAFNYGNFAETLVLNPPVSNASTISVIKTSSPDPVAPGATLTYTIIVTSTGSGTAYNVTVNDTYPADVVFNTAQPTPVAGTNNSFIIGNLTPLTIVRLNITVNVTAASGTVINNTANATFNNESGALLSSTGSVSTTVQSPTPPSPGGGGGGGSGGRQGIIVTPAKAEQPAACVENWECSDWTRCENNRQSRECIELNGCAPAMFKPATTRSCKEEIVQPEIEMPSGEFGQRPKSGKPVVYVENPSFSIQGIVSPIVSLFKASLLPIVFVLIGLLLAVLIVVELRRRGRNKGMPEPVAMPLPLEEPEAPEEPEEKPKKEEPKKAPVKPAKKAEEPAEPKNYELPNSDKKFYGKFDARIAAINKKLAKLDRMNGELRKKVK